MNSFRGAASLVFFCALNGAAEPRVLGTFPLSSAEYGLSAPQAAAVDETRHELWVGGYYSGNLVVVDALTRRPLASVGGMSYLSAVAADPGRGRVYALASNALHVVDSATRKKLATHYLSNHSPSLLAVDPAQGQVYVYGYAYSWADPLNPVFSQRLARIDPANGAILASLDLPNDHYGARLAVSGARAYLSFNFYDSAANKYRPGLWVVDTASFSVLQKLEPGPDYLYGMALSPEGDALYLSDPARLWLYRPDAAGRLVKVSSASSPGLLWDITLDSAGRRLYGPERFMNRVAVVDAASLKLIKTFPAGLSPAAIALDRGAGFAFTANHQSNSVTVYDIKADTPTAALDLSRYEPQALAMAPDAGVALAACGVTGAVAFLDPKTMKLAKAVPETYGEPTGLAYFPGLQKAFLRSGIAPNAHIRKVHLDGRNVQTVPYDRWNVASLVSYPEAGRLLAVQTYLSEPPYNQGGLTVFDALTEFPVKTIALGPSSDSPRAAAVNAATGKAYVVLYATRQVQAVDLATGQALKRIGVGYYPQAVAVNPNLNRIYVANYGSNSLSVIDGASDSVIASVAVGPGPKAVAVKKRGARVYVANSGDGTITVLDGKTLRVISTLRPGGFPVDLYADEASDRIYAANASSAAVTVVEDQVAADSKPPVVSHTPLAGPFPEGKSVTIEASVTDDTGVGAVTLTYWEPGARAYYTIPMIPAGGSNYRGVIPGDFLYALRGGKVAYFIDASDAEGNGPPTGEGAGTAAAPNEFSVAKGLTTAWNYSFGKVFGGFYRMVPGPSAAIGEIRPDYSGLEIASGNEEFWPIGGGPSGRWFLFSSTGGPVFWKNTENDEAHSSVNLFDLDGDGLPEMLGGTTSGNQLQAWDRLARWVWRVILGSHHISTPAAEVLKPGEAPTVFGGSFDGKFRAVNGKDGTPRWTFPAGTWIWSSPAVADLDGDGAPEVVFGTDQLGTGSANLYVLDASTGGVRWKASLGGHVRASAALADMDGDGIKEVLIGAPDGIFRAYHGKTGTLLWSFKTGGEIVSSAAVGDMDSDGRPEVVFGSADGRLYCLGAGGVPRWSADLGSPILGSPALARRQPGQGLDVYVTAAGGVLHLVRGSDGLRLAGLGVGAGVVSSPVVGDIDGDGRLEIIFQDRYGDTTGAMAGDRLWAVRDLGSKVEAYAREWALFRRDPAHTGVYPWAALPPPPALDTQAPVSKITAPADGTVFSTTSVSISGTASDERSGVAKVEVSFRDMGEAAVTWHVAKGTAAFQLSLSALKDNRSYESYSRATDGAGNQETPASVVRFRVDLPPGPVTGLAAVVTSSGPSAKLTWDPAWIPDLGGYRVYDQKGLLIATVSTNSFTAHGLAYVTGYSYSVSIVDKAGQEGPKTSVSFTTPSAPDTQAPFSKITAPVDGTVLSTTAVSISGTASDERSGVAKVEVSIKDLGEAAVTWHVAKGTAAFQLSLSALKDNHSYESYSRATDGAGNQETPVSVVRYRVDLPPGPVTGLAAVVTSSGPSAKLTWDPAWIPDLGGYRVYDQKGQLAATVSTNSFTALGLSYDTGHSYSVSIVDKAGQEGPKTAVSFKTPPPPDTQAPVSKITSPADGTVFSTTSASISGTASDERSGVAKVEVSLRDMGEAAIAWQVAKGTAAFQLSLSALKDNHSYESYSRATDGAGNQETPVSVVRYRVDLPPGPVTGLAADPASTGNSARLTWDKSTIPDLGSYRVYDGSGKLIADVPTNSLEVQGLAFGTGYSYQVSIVDKAGQEGPKTGISFTTPADSACTATIKIPKDGKRLWGNAVTIMAETDCPVSGVLFQQRYETVAAWTNIASTDSKKPYAVYWNVSDARMSTGTHFVRAVAFDQAGRPDLNPPQITLIIDDANADIVEDGNPEVDPNNEHKLSAAVKPNLDQTVSLADGTEVTIPAGSVAAADVLEVKSVSTKEAPPPASGNALLKPAGVFRSFAFASGARSFARKISVSLPVPDEDGDGKADGSNIPASSLKPYYFDEQKKWLPVSASAAAGGAAPAALAASPVSGQGSGAVRFETDHFTLFGLFQELPLKSNLSFGEVYAYPNPARGGTSPTFHVEAGWADSIQLRIYDSAGALVHSAEVAGPPQAVDDGQGVEQAYEYRWEAAGVPSGVYRFVVVARQNGAGSVTKAGKCAIIK